MHTYYFDVNEANQLDPGTETATHVWKKLYDFKSEYRVADMSPSSIKDLFERFGQDSELLNQYYWNSNSRGKDRPTQKTGDPTYTCHAFIDANQIQACVNKVYGTGIMGWFNYFKRLFSGKFSRLDF